jgi:hypothetical protein
LTSANGLNVDVPVDITAAPEKAGGKDAKTWSNHILLTKDVQCKKAYRKQPGHPFVRFKARQKIFFDAMAARKKQEK